MLALKSELKGIAMSSIFWKSYIDLELISSLRHLVEFTNNITWVWSFHFRKVLLRNTIYLIE